MGIRVCSFVNLPEHPAEPITLDGMTLEQILDAIVERNPGYRWDEPSVELINVFPNDSILNCPAPTVTARSNGAWRVLRDALRIDTLGIVLFNELADPDGPSIELDLKQADLRTALNAIVGQLEPLVWHVEGRPNEYYLSFTGVDMSAPRAAC